MDLDIRFTTAELDADKIAAEEIAQGATSIIVSGGDGTLSAAAAALVNCACAAALAQDIVCQEFTKGFMVGDTLVRPAMVAVSSG